jgi:cell division protein FtsN
MLPFLADLTPLLFFGIFVAIILLNVFAALGKKQQERQQQEMLRRQSQVPPPPDYTDVRRQAESRELAEMRRLRDLASAPAGGDVSKLDRELRRRREEARRLREQAQREMRKPRPSPARPSGTPQQRRAGGRPPVVARQQVPRVERPRPAQPAPQRPAAPPPMPPMPPMTPAPAMHPIQRPPVAIGASGVTGARSTASPRAAAINRWLTPQTLRSQFILTEILQPPLGLREPRA